MRIILPTDHVANDNSVGPLFFLVGPVRGGGDWQAKCCDLLLAGHDGKFRVAVPCQWENSHRLSKYFVGSDERFSRQLQWERHYLQLAGQRALRGCIVAWLPAQDKANPRNDGEPYGRDTYGEVGEWRGRLAYDASLRFVLGGESGFPGLDVIRRNFLDVVGPEFVLHTTLEETVDHALKKAR